MYSDHYYKLDLTVNNDEVFKILHEELTKTGFIKVKCLNIPNNDCDKVCLDVITGLGGILCPYNDNPESFIWPVKVLELDSENSKLQASQLDRELVFHTDCSYEHDAPEFVALYVVQCDRSEKGGKFQMVRTVEIVENLSEKSRKILREEEFKIKVPADFRKNNLEYICGKILLEGDEHIRYRRDILDREQLKTESIEKQEAIDELNSVVLGENRLTIFRPVLENNMMVLFNNRRFVHGRTKIQDLERYFLRVRFNLA